MFSEGIDMLSLEEQLKKREELLSLSGETPVEVPKVALKKGQPLPKAQGPKWGKKTPKGGKKETALKRAQARIRICSVRT